LALAATPQPSSVPVVSARVPLEGAFQEWEAAFPKVERVETKVVAVVVEVSQVSAAKVAPLALLEWEASRDWVSMVAWDRCETVAWVKCLASFAV